MVDTLFGACGATDRCANPSCSVAGGCGGQMLGIGCRGLVAKRRVGALGIVVLDPFGEHGGGVAKAVEQGLVQEFVAQAPVEALDEAVFPGRTPDE